MSVYLSAKKQKCLSLGIFLGSGHITLFLGGVPPQKFSGPRAEKDRPSP